LKTVHTSLHTYCTQVYSNVYFGVPWGIGPRSRDKV